MFNKTKVLEPIYTIIKIALLNFYPDNTKISINDNQIHCRLPTMYQGILRWSYGEDRTDIKYIIKSIVYGLKILKNLQIKPNTILFNLYCGINKLTLCYIDDDKYKKKLQKLEMIVKNNYEKDTLEIDNKIVLLKKGEYDLNKVVYFWKKETIEFIEDNFTIITNLYKLHKNINIIKKKEYRTTYISIIKNIINLKNNTFKKDLLN